MIYCKFEQGLIFVICIQYLYVIFLLLYSLYMAVFSAEIKYIIIIIIINGQRLLLQSGGT